jgi:hypothetical protein
MNREQIEVLRFMGEVLFKTVVGSVHERLHGLL